MLKINITRLFRHPQFISYCLIVMISYGGILAWLTVSPVLLQQQSGLDPIQYSFTTAMTGAAYGLCNFINSRCVEYFKTTVMIRFGLILMLGSSLIMIFFWVFFHSTQAVCIVIPAMLFVGSTGFVFSNAIASALEPFPQIAGIAGSIFGALQIAGGAITSAILASFAENTQVPFGVCMLLCAVIGIIAFAQVSKHAKEKRP